VKIKEVQCSGVITLGAKFINVTGSQLAIVSEDDRIVALLGPANDTTTQLEAELMFRALQGDNAKPGDQLMAIVRREMGGWQQMAHSLKAVSEAVAGTAQFAGSRAASLALVVEEAEQAPVIQVPR